jgi:hypothetical protein
MEDLAFGEKTEKAILSTRPVGRAQACPRIKFRMSLPSQFKKLKARSALMRGIEPYPEIRDRANEPKPGESLDVLAPSHPTPLIENLGSEGFKSEIERAGGGGWFAYFGRETV